MHTRPKPASEACGRTYRAYGFCQQIVGPVYRGGKILALQAKPSCWFRTFLAVLLFPHLDMPFVAGPPPYAEILTQKSWVLETRTVMRALLRPFFLRAYQLMIPKGRSASASVA